MNILSRRYLSRVAAESVVVNTNDGTSIRGILVGVYTDVLVLKHAQMLADGGDPLAIDGEACIDRAKVVWIQRLGGDQ